MVNNFGVPGDLIMKLALLKADARIAEQKISEVACANLGIAVGGIMIDKYSGLYYKIKGFSAYVDMRNQVKISVQAYRYYRTGRKAGKTAKSTSFGLSFDDLEKLP